MKREMSNLTKNTYNNDTYVHIDIRAYTYIEHYYTLNSLSLFWLAESIQWIFEISACDVITADYTVSHVKITQGHGLSCHVQYNRSAWFLRVIMSSSRALCCLPSVKKQKNYFQVCFLQFILIYCYLLSHQAFFQFFTYCLMLKIFCQSNYVPLICICLLLDK